MKTPRPGLAALVLGMHRSGTSALAGALSLLGFALGREVLEAQAGVNDRGFFENVQLVRWHEAALAALSSHWSDFRRYTASEWQKPELRPVIQGLQDFLAAEFSPEQAVVLKDPRQCRLLPLWQSILAGSRHSPIALLMFRHPFEVAQSLQRRDGLGADHALALWLRSVLDAENQTRGHARAAIAYGELLADWRQSLGRVPGLLPEGAIAAEIQEAVDGFLSADLKHHQEAGWQAGCPELRALCLAAYEALQVAVTGNLDDLFERFDVMAEASDRVIAGSEAPAQSQAFIGRLYHCAQTERLERDREILRLIGAMQAGDEHRQKLLSDIAARDEQIRRLTEEKLREVGERDREIRRLTEEKLREVGERDREIRRLQALVAELQAHGEQLQEGIQQRDAIIGHYQGNEQALTRLLDEERQHVERAQESLTRLRSLRLVRLAERLHRKTLQTDIAAQSRE